MKPIDGNSYSKDFFRDIILEASKADLRGMSPPNSPSPTSPRKKAFIPTQRLLSLNI
jgi:hypothetical protein